MNLGPTELILILLLIVVIFGGRKIPELARGLGQGIREFKSASKEPPRRPEDEAAPDKE